MNESDAIRREALIALLSLPDGPDIQHRGHRRTLEGLEDRHRILPMLTGAFIQHHIVELEERAAQFT